MAEAPTPSPVGQSWVDYQEELQKMTMAEKVAMYSKVYGLGSPDVSWNPATMTWSKPATPTPKFPGAKKPLNKTTLLKDFPDCAYYPETISVAYKSTTGYPAMSHRIRALLVWWMFYGIQAQPKALKAQKAELNLIKAMGQYASACGQFSKELKVLEAMYGYTKQEYNSYSTPGNGVQPADPSVSTSG